MASTFKAQPPMILSLPGFMITANYGLSSKDVSEQLTVAICPSLHLLPSKVFIGTEKAYFHRTASLYATLTCSLRIFWQAGKVLRQILVSGLMHWQKDFQCPKDSIILQMQDIHIARNFSFLFVVFGIIFRSGVLLVFGMCFVIYIIFCDKLIIIL